MWGGGRRRVCPPGHWLLLLLAAVTCGPVAGDGQPGRLVGLSYIIGHFTNILAALLLRHVVERQHLSVGAIDPRMLEIKTRRCEEKLGRH